MSPRRRKPSDYIPRRPQLLLAETFTGTGTFASEDAFWTGQRDNPDWFCTSGSLLRTPAGGRVADSNPFFRLWTHRTDLSFVLVELTVRFDGYYREGEAWDGLVVMLQRSLRIRDRGLDEPGGEAGYFIDFHNRGGFLEVLKKTNDPEPAGTYRSLARGAAFIPELHRPYRFAAGCRPIDGGVLLQGWRDGVEVLRAEDRDSPLTGGHVGLRADRSDVLLSGLSISRS